jgi:hypothetical protein
MVNMKKQKRQKYDITNIYPDRIMNVSFDPILHDFIYWEEENNLIAPNVKPVTAIVGPIGSGKTVACLFKLLFLTVNHAKANPFDGIKRAKYLVVRSTNISLSRTVWDSISKWLPAGYFGEARYDNNTISNYTITAFDGLEIEFLFFGIESDNQIQNLLSLDLTGVWLSEFREFPFKYLLDLYSRTGRYPSEKDGGCGWSGMLMESNPFSKESDWYKFWVLDKTPKKLKEQNAPRKCFKQPGGLSPEAENIRNLTAKRAYYTQLIELHGQGDTSWINVMVNAEYGSIRTGLPVHKNFKHNVHVAKSNLELENTLPLVISFDFGLTPACTYLQHRRNGQIYILDEEASDNMSLEEFLENWVKPKIINYYPNVLVIITGDPSGGKRSDTDKSTAWTVIQKTLRCKIYPAYTNFFQPRRDALDSRHRRMIKGEPAILYSPVCEILIDAIEYKFKYPEKKGSLNSYAQFKETPDKNIYSHIAEALEYGVMYIDSQMNQENLHIYESYSINSSVNQLAWG